MPELWIDSLLCDFGLITRQRSKHSEYPTAVQILFGTIPVLMCSQYTGLEMKDSRSSILGIRRPPSIDSFMVKICMYLLTKINLPENATNNVIRTLNWMSVTHHWRRLQPSKH